jgi:hypothetical protein
MIGAKYSRGVSLAASTMTLRESFIASPYIQLLPHYR